jgi:hypothetical protein
MIEHTLNDYATSAGIESRTLERKFVKNGFTFKPRELIPLKAYNCAMLGEKAEAEIRLKNAQAADQERKNKIADGETIPLADNLKWQDNVLMPIRQRLLSMSGTLAHLVNPTDPKHAQDQIDRYVAETLTMLRTEIGKVKE